MYYYLTGELISKFYTEVKGVRRNEKRRKVELVGSKKKNGRTSITRSQYLYFIQEVGSKCPLNTNEYLDKRTSEVVEIVNRI